MFPATAGTAQGGLPCVAPSSRPKSSASPPIPCLAGVSRRSGEQEERSDDRTSRPPRLPRVGVSTEGKAESATWSPPARRAEPCCQAWRYHRRHRTHRDSTANTRQSRRRRSPRQRRIQCKTLSNAARFAGERRQSDEGATQSKIRAVRAFLTGGLPSPGQPDLPCGHEPTTVGEVAAPVPC